MSGSRTPQVLAVALAALLAAGTYLALTEGVEALRATGEVAGDGPGHVPAFVHDPPDTLPTTADFGPAGPVSIVFAADEVRIGLTGRMENPWVAVSSQDGEYRALSAPHRPEPRRDAIAVSADGRRLAWAYPGGVVLYDPVRDTSVELTTPAAGRGVGPFSPDGSRLLVYDGALHVLDTETGQVLATVAEVGADTARQAVWTPDGATLSYVADGELVLHRWDDGRSRVAALPVPVTTEQTLAWSPSGARLGVMREVRGVRTVEVLDVGRRGVTHAGTVRAGGHAQRELLGFTGEQRVTVTALTMETAGIPLVFDMSTEEAVQPTRLMQLPSRAEAVETMEFAAAPLAEGSLRFDEPDWPTSDLAKLVASVVVSGFLLGLYLTRRPRASARST